MDSPRPFVDTVTNLQQQTAGGLSTMENLIDIEQARVARHRPAGPRHTFFSRSELFRLLNLYSRRVMSGEWRDYAIDHDSSSATFSVYRNATEHPEFAITKIVGHKGRHGLFVLRSGPRRLKQSPSLDDVITALEKRLRLVWSTS